MPRWANETVRTGHMPGTVRPALATLVTVLAATLALACRAGPNDCAYESSERCLWERGVAPPGEAPSPDSAANDDDEGQLGGDAVTDEPTKFEDTLAEMVSIIGAGIEWSFVDESARALCSDVPHAPQSSPSLPAPTAESWTCPVVGLELGEYTFELEASDGVLSLSAINIGEAQSSELFEFAQRRYDGWCADQAFKPFEGDGLAVFYRCSLAAGPYLVVARFPRDLEAGRWQVSIAIVDAG